MLVTVVLGGAMVDFFIQLVTGHQRKLLTQSRTWALLFFLLLLFLVLIASARTRRLDSSRGDGVWRGRVRGTRHRRDGVELTRVLTQALRRR